MCSLLRSFRLHLRYKQHETRILAMNSDGCWEPKDLPALAEIMGIAPGRQRMLVVDWASDIAHITALALFILHTGNPAAGVFFSAHNGMEYVCSTLNMTDSEVLALGRRHHDEMLTW
jgi:hypothetical protein